MKQMEAAVAVCPKTQLLFQNGSEFDVSLSYQTGSPPKDCGEFDFPNSIPKAKDVPCLLLK